MPQKIKKQLPPLKDVSGTIGQNIEAIRKKLGLTQEQLADKIGIAQALVSKYEIGRLQISAEMIIRFAQALQVSTDQILGFNGEPVENSNSLKLMRRLREIEKLSESDQKALLKTIDKYIN